MPCHSLNVSREGAEQVGYGAVVDLPAGLAEHGISSPRCAGGVRSELLEIAGGYTIYANHGIYSKPYFLSSINNDHGSKIFDGTPEHRAVLDPRVAFLMDQLLEEVVHSGTGAGMYGRGINFPVAGKTGTSDHDGWFAGFTSKLICVVWVGFDDNRELKLEGAHSALPVWAEFMKRAHLHREYRNVSEFSAPAGIVSVPIDPASGQLATGSCPKVRNEYFIQGTQPVEMCQLHGGGGTQVASWDTAPAPERRAERLPSQGSSPGQQQAARNIPASAPEPPAAHPQEPPKKKSLLDKIRGIFK
jgi:penicillin-binding protein 1B